MPGQQREDQEDWKLELLKEDILRSQQERHEEEIRRREAEHNAMIRLMQEQIRILKDKQK